MRGRTEIVHLILKTKPTLLLQKSHCILFRMKHFSFLPSFAPEVCKVGFLFGFPGGSSGSIMEASWEIAAGGLLGWHPPGRLLCLFYSWVFMQDVWRRILQLKQVWSINYWVELKLWLLLLLLAVVFPLPHFPPSLTLLPSLLFLSPEHNYYILVVFIVVKYI